MRKLPKPKAHRNRRVWGKADPTLLSHSDLTIEHRHTHEMLDDVLSGKLQYGDSKRFDSKFGQSCLVLRHEMVRLALNYRFPGHHTSKKHPTPIDIGLLTEEHVWCRLTYAKWIAGSFDQMVPRSGAPFTSNQDFIQMMKVHAHFPMRKTDTPWEARGTDMDMYLRSAYQRDKRFRDAQRYGGSRHARRRR